MSHNWGWSRLCSIGGRAGAAGHESEGGREEGKHSSHQGFASPWEKKCFLTKHKCVKEEEKSPCPCAEKLFRMIIVRCLAAVGSVTITTPCCWHPPAWLVFWWRRNQVISQNIACLFPLTPAIRHPANVSSWHSEVIFSSVLGVAVTHPEGLGSISACLLSLFPVCVFYMTSPARCASCYIHKSPCEVCTPHPPSALVSRRSRPTRFDQWKRNDAQVFVLAFNLLQAVPSVCCGPAGLTSWSETDMEFACQATNLSGSMERLWSRTSCMSTLKRSILDYFQLWCGCCPSGREGGQAVSKHPGRPTSILQYWQFCQSQKGFFIRRKGQKTAIKSLLAIVAEHCGVALQSLCHLFFKIKAKKHSQQTKQPPQYLFWQPKWK